MPRAAALLTLAGGCLVIFAGATIPAQNPGADLTGGIVGTIRDLPPDVEPTGEGPGGPESRWRTVSATAQDLSSPVPGVPLPEFLELGCAKLGTDAVEKIDNCTNIQDHGGSRAICTVKCGELAVGGATSASAFVRGGDCRCCLSDDILEDAEWIDVLKCNVLCPDQDDKLYNVQPFKAQRRFADPWTCGGEQDTWTVFRQYDAVSPLGRRGAYSPLFGAWYEVVILPERLLPGIAGVASPQSLDNSRWYSHPGLVYYINAIHIGLGWPIFWHQARLAFGPECLHVDERGRLLALARRNATASGAVAGFDALIFDAGCGSQYVQDPQVIPALDSDAHVSACTFDIERAVLAFLAHPNEGMGPGAVPSLIEVEIVRGVVSKRNAPALEEAVSLEQCRQINGGTVSRPSLSALVVSDGAFSVLPPQGLAGMGLQSIRELGPCRSTPGDTACKLPGPDRFALQMQTTSSHATKPFMHVATEIEAYTGKEFDDQASAQLAEFPCEPGAGESIVWPSSVPGHHRRRGANLESPHTLYRHRATGTTARRCARGFECDFIVEGVGVTGDDHLVGVRLSQEQQQVEASSLTCDLRGMLVRAIAGSRTQHEYFRHADSSALWTSSPVFTNMTFVLPGLFLLCFYSVPACSGNISDAVFSGLFGENIGALKVKGPALNHVLYCGAFAACELRVNGSFFDEPLFAYLGTRGSCTDVMDGWQGQPWKFTIATVEDSKTTIDIPTAMPLASNVICYCPGALDGSDGPFLNKCQGPGVPFGSISSSIPSSGETWIVPGNFRATDNPLEYIVGGIELSDSNRLIIIPLEGALEFDPHPCAGKNLKEEDVLLPSGVSPAAIMFRFHSMTPDEGFNAYGMPDHSLQLSPDRKVLRSSYMKSDFRWAVCHTDKDVIRPFPDAVRAGTLILETSVCGDGVLTLPEACDDGNTVSGDGCAAGCEKVEEGWRMRHENIKETRYGAPGGPILEAICGDGLIRGQEICDDNNTVPGDGCDDKCYTEKGWTCEWNPGLRRSLCTPICGDYTLSPLFETCDDGNQRSGDGCSPSCQVEPGFKCVQKPLEDPENGIFEESVSFCRIDCEGNAAEMIGRGIFRCEAGVMPPTNMGPHWCVMYPRDCAGMPPYQGPYDRWLGCTQTAFEVKSQCQVITPPAVSSIAFERIGTILSVIPDQKALFRFPTSGEATCSLIFQDAAEMLGQGATCTQSSETLLQVTLGRKPKLRPNMNLTLLGGAMYLDPAPLVARTGSPQWPPEWPYVESVQAGMPVSLPLGGFLPLVAKLQSQSKTGLGADIELVASESSGGGGQLEFFWGLLDVELHPVWRERFFGVEEEQRILQEFRDMLSQALVPFERQPVALVPAKVIITMDEILLRAAGLLGDDGINVLEPILLRFSMTAVSLFDGQTAKTEWLVKVFQYAVPLVKREAGAAMNVRRDLPVTLHARVLAPGGLPFSRLPPFQLSWRSERGIDVSQFVTSNPGLVKIPGSTYPRGRWAFILDCTYFAPSGTEEKVVTNFDVTFELSVPVAVLDGPENASAACDTTISAARSYDPGLIIPGTMTPITPLPSDLYQFEWECWFLGEGKRFMAADDRLIAGLMGIADECNKVVPGGITVNGMEFSIAGGTFRGNTLLQVRMRVKPPTGSITQWYKAVLRLLSVAVPSVSFPQVPPSPLRPGIPHQVWALSVSSLDCPQTGTARPSLLNIGLNAEVEPEGGLPAVELVQAYPGLENVPAAVRTKVLADNSGNAIVGRVLYVYWLRIRAGAMKAGYRYRVILRGDDGSSSNPGWFSQTPVIEANAGPRGGALSVDPLRGQAVETTFRLSVTEWEDPHIPLSFIFFLRPVGGSTSSRIVLSDWSRSAAVLIPLPVGDWTVISRARDALGVESDPAGDLLSDPVVVDEAPIAGAENLARVSLIADRSTDASQVLSSVSSILDASGASGRRLSGTNGTNGTNSSGISAALAGSMIKAMDKGQKFLVGAGSKSGASRQAAMLLGITSGIGNNNSEDTNGTSDGPNETEMASSAARILGSTFTLLEGAEDAEDPTGVNTDEAKDFVATASALAVMEVPDGSGGRRLAKRELDVAASNTLGSVADGIGRQLAQGLISQNSSEPPAPIKTPGLTVAAAALPVMVGQASSSARRLGGMEGTDRITIQIPGIGTFGIPTEALAKTTSSLSDVGYQGSSSAGMSANQWGGNPFGPRERKTVYGADCGGAGSNGSLANGSFLFGKNLSLGALGNTSANASGNLSQGMPCSGGAESTEASSAESNVVSVSLSSALGLSSKIAALRNPITIAMTVGQDYWDLQDKMSRGSGIIPQCMWWDPQKNSWGGDGCKTLAVRNKGKELLCSCTHLTSFGAFAEEGGNVLAGANFDVIFDFSYESLRADNPTLWFVVGVFVLQLVWLGCGIWADYHGYTGGTEEQMKAIYFPDAPSEKPVQAKKTVQEATGVQGTGEDTKPKLRKKIKDMLPDRKAPSPTLDLLHFRNMIRATLEHNHISWMDLSSKRVQKKVHQICKEEAKHAMTKHHDDIKTGHKKKLRQSLVKVFRGDLANRLSSQMGRKALTARSSPKDMKTRRHQPGLPSFPWSFQATMKVTCRNVHPMEQEPQVRHQLRVDEVLDVLVVADEQTVKLYVRDDDIEGVDDLTAEHEPFIEVSWLAIADHEGIESDRPVEADTRESTGLRVAERLEERAASALVVPPQRYGRAAGGEVAESQSAQVEQLVEEWEEDFLMSRERGHVSRPLPPPASGRGPPPPAPAGRPPPLVPSSNDSSVPDEDEGITEELDDAPEVDEYMRWIDSHPTAQSESLTRGAVANAPAIIVGPRAAGATAQVAMVAPPRDGDSSEGSSREDDPSGAGLASDGTRLPAPPDPPPLAQLLQESGHGSAPEPGARAVGFSDDFAEAAVQDWEESLMLSQLHGTPRLATQAANLSYGSGLEFWRCGGSLSEATGLPTALLSHAMLLIVSASPPSGDAGDMSWVTSGWFFSWSPLRTRGLKRLQNQARQRGMDVPEVPARVEILLCGLQPRIQAELRTTVPKLVDRARKEEEATQENLARARRRRAAAATARGDASETEDENGEGLSSVEEEEEEESEAEREDAQMRALEARWSAPTRGDLRLARGGDNRQGEESSSRRPRSEDVECAIYVGLPDSNEEPMQAQVLVEEVRWSPMHMSIEDDPNSMDNAEGGPAVLRFSDMYSGSPIPFSGWTVPMGRITNVRVLRPTDYPLPPLDSSVAAGDVRPEVFDIDALAEEAANTAARSPNELPQDFQEILEIVVAPRNQPLYRIMLRPADGAAAHCDRLAYNLKNAVTAWQDEHRLSSRPRLAELSRVGQLERQAEDFILQAREAQDLAKRDSKANAERQVEDMQQIDDCIDLLFRRYEFILWDPFTLTRRIIIRDHPMTGIFVPHLRSFAVERVLIFSCALAGSLMAAGLFFDAGIGGAASPSGGNSTAANSTQDPGALLSTATTTTTTTVAATADPFRQIISQLIVSLLSVLIAGIPAGFVWYLFRRQVMKDVKNEFAKRRILRWWKIRRRTGYVVAGVFLAYCYFFLWQFAMNRAMDVQRDFAASSAINLVWKIVLKPAIVFFIIALLITTLRLSTVFDSLMFLVPFSALDFTMFTAKDVDDLLVYDQLVDGFMGAGDGAEDLIL